MGEPKFPDAFVQLTGEDGNTGAIMGRVVRELKRVGASPDDIRDFRMSIMEAASYDDALNRVGQWVEVG